MFIKVLVTPKARKERVEERPNGVLEISVREPSAENRANIRVRQLVAARFGVPVVRVRIMTGHHHRSKMISVTSI